jgi:hypothetical protein
MQNINMVEFLKIALAFGLMAITYEPLNLGMWHSVRRQIINVLHSADEILFTSKQLQICRFCETLSLYPTHLTKSNSVIM